MLRAEMSFASKEQSPELAPLTAADVMHARDVAAFLRVPMSTVVYWAR